MIPLPWYKRLAVVLGWMNEPETKPKRGPVLLCVRCNHFVKKGEGWSRKKWDDGLVRHDYNCTHEQADESFQSAVAEEMIAPADVELSHAVTPLTQVRDGVYTFNERVTPLAKAVGAGESGLDPTR